MTMITLVNKVPESTAPSAEFRLYKGLQHQDLGTRVGVHAGGEASIPTQGTGYTAVAVTQLQEMTLTSNEVTFDGDSQELLAQVVAEDGTYDFRLVARSGTQLSAIVCENTWRNPVQFTLKQTGTPLATLLVVDEHNTTLVSTAQQWQCYAIVNGITTTAVEFKGPSALVTLTASGDDSYALSLERTADAPSTDLKALPRKAESAQTAASIPEPARAEDASIEAQVLSVTPAA